MTNRSWAARAAQDETGLPFSSTANATLPPIRPESVQARSVVPVFPFTFPRSAGSRLLSVPLTPATASEPTKAARIAGSVAPARSTPTSASAVRRSRLESPEPSTMRTPSTGMPASRIVATTSLPPPADVPTLPVAARSCLSSISA